MLNQLNYKFFSLINHFAENNVILDKFEIVLAEYLPIIFIIFLLYLWFNKNERKNFVLYSGYSAIIGVLLNFLITLFYFHPRPFMDHVGKLLISHLPETSFPSDHTTFMLSIAFMFLYFKKTRKIGIILSIFGVMGGIARIYCGLHYPFDILGSIIVAIISSGIVFITKVKIQRFNNLIIRFYCKVLKYK